MRQILYLLELGYVKILMIFNKGRKISGSAKMMIEFHQEKL
jgi:hypothetical protein